MRSPISSRTHHSLFPQVVFSVLALVIVSLAQSAFAQSAREQVAGVKNFGRVTDRFFRGGAVTPDGVGSLAEMGVRTIIDLRDSPSADEPGACEHNGIKYLSFPMTGHETPSNKDVGEILSIIQSAREPVYVHCSAGKHRVGTIAALYRTRVQGWSKEKAWAEQEAYGFGGAEGHPELYSYVYGSRDQDIALNDTRAETRSASVDDPEDRSSSNEKREELKSSKAGKDDDERGYKSHSKGDHDYKSHSKGDHGYKDHSKGDHEHKDHSKKDGHGKKKD